MTVALARRYQLQVSADNTTWLNVKGVNDFNPSENPTIVGADTYDTNGINAFEKTMIGPKAIAKFLRPVAAGVYDPGQELIRATRFQFGASARLYFRWWDKGGAADAYAGYALLEWEPSKTGVADVEEVTVTFTVDGVFAAISNPYSVTVVPIITSITPSGAGTGNAVAIVGSGFTGTVVTTGVKFNAINATSFTVINDNLITAVLPSAAAATIPVLVTNASGASLPFSFNRGA
jgi:hypothetical protein